VDGVVAAIAVELRKGIIELSDDDLAVMRSKVMRFVSILGAAESARSSNTEREREEGLAGARPDLASARLPERPTRQIRRISRR
jgi:hypothetical protein